MTTGRARGAAARLLGAVVASVALASCSDARDVARQDFVPAIEGTLVVATDLPAPGFWVDGDGAGEPTGFEHELARLLAERFGLRLRIDDVPFAEIIAGRVGTADLAIAQVSITDDRAEVLELSVPYYVTRSAVVGRAGEELTDLKTAREQTWAVQRGSTQADAVADELRPDQATLEVDSVLEAVQAVLDGEVDAALVDLPSAYAALRTLDPKGASLAVVASLDTDERYAVAFPSDAPEGNLRAVDAAIRALQSDGTLDDLIEEWLLPLYGTDPDELPVIRIR